MDFTNYINAELLVLVPVLYALGMIFKSARFFIDRYIPFFLTIIGVVLSCLYVIGTQGFNIVSIFTAIVQGVLVTAAAVYTNQLIKQPSK